MSTHHRSLVTFSDGDLNKNKSCGFQIICSDVNMHSGLHLQMYRADAWTDVHAVSWKTEHLLNLPQSLGLIEIQFIVKLLDWLYSNGYQKQAREPSCLSSTALLFDKVYPPKMAKKLADKKQSWLYLKSNIPERIF